MTILSAFRCALRTSGSQEQSLAPESMIEALRISKQYECSRVDFVAQKMRMTTRNLNYRSVKELGMSPKKLIKSAALRDAMISITSCSKTGKAIGDIAFENGFESFSRFSADYRMLFGERPSATYQRYFRE
ncbi:helix-turn-helix domain-containing protein [Novosphingobium sp. MW5]|nr:helix-turn-helix domain-containing protein [Novosphingobium sp. MW5]